MRTKSKSNSRRRITKMSGGNGAGSGAYGALPANYVQSVRNPPTRPPSSSPSNSPISSQVSTTPISQNQQGDVTDCINFKKELLKEDLDTGIKYKLTGLYAEFKKEPYEKIMSTSEASTWEKKIALDENTLAIVIKKDKINHTNIFYKHTVTIGQINIPVLVRCQKILRLRAFGENLQEISVRGIYFMGFDTNVRGCNLSMNCNHIIHDLYKLTEDGTKLNKTDIQIYRRGKDDTSIASPDVAEPTQQVTLINGEQGQMTQYDIYINRLTSFIRESKNNMYSTLILLKLPTDHNILKIFGKDVLMGLKSVPVTLGKTAVIGTGATLGVLSGTVVGLGTLLGTGSVTKAYDKGSERFSNTLDASVNMVRGGKKRTKKKAHINKLRRYIRRSRKL